MERRGRILSLTIWKCPRGEPAACRFFRRETPETEPFPALALALEDAVLSMRALIPETSQGAWERGVTRDPYAFLWLGRAALPFLRGEDAEEPLRRALRIDPRMAEGWMMRGILASSKAETPIQERRKNPSGPSLPDPAATRRRDPADDLARADVLRPGFSAARRALATLHLQQGRTEQALMDLASLASLRTGDLQLALERADTHLLGRDGASATAVLDSLPEALRNSVPVGRMRARVAEEGENVEEAEAWLERVVATDAQDGESLLKLAALTRRRGANSEAEAWYRQALAAGAETPARVGLMQLLGETSRWKEALSEARTLQAAHPSESRWWRWAAWLSLAADDAGEASRRYAALAGDHPKDGELRLGHCVSLIRTQDSMAHAVCSEATRIDARNPRAWLALGLALQTTGDLPGAASASRRALALDPDLKDAQALLADSLPPGDPEGRRARARSRIP